IDPLKRIVVQTIGVGSSPSGITTGNGAVWVANSLDGTVSRIDPGTNTVVPTIDVGNGPVGIAYAGGSIWVANTGDDTITSIDAASGKPTKTVPIAATELAFGAGTLWASERTANRVARIEPATGSVVGTIPVGNRPQGVAISSGRVLVSVRQSGAGHRGGTLTFRMNRSPDSIDTAIAYDSTSWPILRMTNDGLVALDQASGLQGTQLVPDLAV